MQVDHVNYRFRYEEHVFSAFYVCVSVLVWGWGTGTVGVEPYVHPTFDNSYLLGEYSAGERNMSRLECHVYNDSYTKMWVLRLQPDILALISFWKNGPKFGTVLLELGLFKLKKLVFLFSVFFHFNLLSSTCLQFLGKYLCLWTLKDKWQSLDLLVCVDWLTEGFMYRLGV